MKNILNLYNENIIDFQTEAQIKEQMRIKYNTLYETAKEKRIVWQGGGKDKRWKFIKNDGKTVARTTEEKIKIAFINYYKDEEKKLNKENLTFEELYNEWLADRKEDVGTKKGLISSSTYNRYIKDYNRYIKGSNLAKTPIININPTYISKFLRKMINENNMSKKCFSNLYSYLNMAFDFACNSEYINRNPLANHRRTSFYGHCRCVEHDSNDRILSKDELNSLISVIHNRQKENTYYIQDYAIELATLTGMRVGELAALRWDSMDNSRIFIDKAERRIEKMDNKHCSYYIGNTKNGKNRVIARNKDINNLFERIKEIQKEHNINNEFIFANKNGRVNSHTISCAMARRCEDAKIKKNTIHGIRRTVSSLLHAQHVPAPTIAKMLGHTEEVNKNHYTYDTSTIEEQAKVLDTLYDTWHKSA